MAKDKSNRVKLSNVNPDPESVVEFLKVNGRSHRSFYHYTDLRSVIGMIKNNKFHLSNGNKMNDHDETKRGSADVWKHIYLASFNFGDNENMALWGLYSIPWETGVRLEIPGKTMRAWIDGLKHKSPLYVVGKDSLGSFTYDLIDNPYHTVLTDVVYADNQGLKKDSSTNLQNPLILKHNSGKLEAPADMDCKPGMSGFIKNEAWSYEQEVRIRIDTYEPLINKQDNKSIAKSIDSESVTDDDYIVEQVAVDFPDEIIEECRITACPWFDGNLEEKLREAIRNIQQIEPSKNMPFGQIGRSKFSDLVNNMKRPCWQCTQGHFEQKA